jgi:DNA-binding SARP family transcriptional activator/tetratricopeptide (TPR) repeat protein/TolB-like protein
MIQLRLFGTVELYSDDEPEPRAILVQPKRLALLAYLAATPRGLRRRDTLLGLFWPELDSERARGALSKALHYLRRALGEGVLVTQGDEEVRVDATRLWCDVAAFERALEEARQAEALELYRGDLMQGFFLSGVPEFERWVEEERDQLRRRAAAAGWALAEAHEAGGDPVGASAWARHAQALGGGDEVGLRRLLTLLERAGDRVGAVQAYEEFARRLAQEYELEPSAETQALIARVREASAPPGPFPVERGAASGVREEPPSPPDHLRVRERGWVRSGVDEGQSGSRDADLRGGRAVSARSTRIAVVGVVAILVMVSLYYYILPRSTESALDPKRVVVAPFENHTGQPLLDPVGSMAADWIIQGLAQTGLVDVVPVTATLAASDLAIKSPGVTDADERIQRVAEETGAGIVVSGAYYQQGDSLYLRATVTDVRHGRVLHALEPITMPSALPLEGIERLRQRLMGALATHLNPRMREHAARTGLAPPSFEAYRAHAEGLELFIARDWPASLTRFAEAAAHDSTFLAPLLFSGLAFVHVGNLSSVDSILVLVRPRLHLIHGGDRLGFEFLEALVRGDLVEAYRAHRRSPELAPGGLAHWGLANSALWVNRPGETVRVSRELDPESGELRGWYYYWRDLAHAHHRLGQHREELRVARRARALFPDEPNAVLLEVRALAALRQERALRALLAEPVHPGRNPVVLLGGAGRELIAHGSSAAGTALLREALDLHRTQRSEDPRFRFFLAGSHRVVGDCEEAERLLRELATEQPGVLPVNVQGLLGTLAARRGDRAEAERISRWLAEFEGHYQRGGSTYYRARIAALLGEREEALDLLRRTHSEGHLDFWEIIHTEPDLDSLRDYPPFHELIRPKG